MEWAALITWVLTAGGGFVLFSIWVSRGGMQQADDGGNRIRPQLVIGHLALAVAGLVIWIVYLAADKDALAWIAFGILVVVALLGGSMFAIWFRRRQARAGGGEVAAPGVPAEQHFPVSIVTLHGLLAVTTVVLVLLAAAGVGS